MKLIVISSPHSEATLAKNGIHNEHEIVTAMFEQGLEMFHVHKPTFSKAEIEKYMRKFPDHFQDRVYQHSFFPKLHSLEDLKQFRPSSTAQIAFLSPVFDSISKQGYKSEFSEQMNKFTQLKPELIAEIKGRSIIALGGIDTDKIELARKVGFKGVASLGAIWNSKDPVEKFVSMQNICNSKAFLRRELFLEEFKQTSRSKPHE